MTFILTPFAKTVAATHAVKVVEYVVIDGITEYRTRIAAGSATTQSIYDGAGDTAND